jgi:hypothetical protein
MSEETGAIPEEANVDYESATSYEWTEKAHAMFDRQKLQGYFLDTDGVLSAHVWGACPRCGHPLDARPVLTTVVTNLRGERNLWHKFTGLLSGHSASDDSAVSDVEVVDIGCGCGYSHPGAPEDTKGCGVSFRLQVPLRRRTR